jgi:murein DD-endopeptidase MepM/ murein hydrolase activator NlpD
MRSAILRRLIVVSFAVLASLSLLGIPVNARQSSPFTVTLDFQALRQGAAGLLIVNGDGITGAGVSVFERNTPCFPSSRGLACFVAVPIEQKIANYPLKVTANRADQSTITWDGTLKVLAGRFVFGRITLPRNKLNLLVPQIQQDEDAQLTALYSGLTPERLWQAGTFLRPVGGGLISPFGALRTFNDGSRRRHTGYDLRATLGLPILVAASGRVSFVGAMPIHGNIVIVDHGWGVFSSYSHLRDILVAAGQPVLRGQTIGLAGTTGRSTGPHLHWEVAVNGVWVDPLAFMTVALPG